MFSRFFKLCLSVAILIASSQSISADSSSLLGKKSEGWYWYKDPLPPEAPASEPAVAAKEEPLIPKEKIIPKEKNPSPSLAKPNQPPSFSVQWLKENFDKIRDEAIENPSDKDKVRAFLYTQRVVLDKAQRFSETAYLIASTDPLLDETSRIPSDQAAKAFFDKRKIASENKLISHLSKTTGIWFFYNSTCDFCEVQYRSIKLLSSNLGFIVKPISIDNKPLKGMKPGDWVADSGQFKALDLKITPSTILVAPPSTFHIVSQGANSLDSLYDKIVLSAKIGNLIPDELYDAVDSYNRGVLNDSDIKSGLKDLDPLSNPGAAVDAIRGKLQKRY